MDNAKLMESWGNLLIQMAGAQRRMDSMAKWAGQWSFPCPKEGNELQENFRNLLNNYLGFFGLVSLEEHQRLAKQYEELKEKVLAQDAALRGRGFFLAPDELPGGVMKQWHDLAMSQAEQYQRLMQDMARVFESRE